MKRKLIAAWAILSAALYIYFLYAVFADRDLGQMTPYVNGVVLFNSAWMLVYYVRKWRAEKQGRT